MADEEENSTTLELTVEEKEHLRKVDERTPEQRQLAALIGEVRQSLRSAENALASEDQARVAQETERLTRMLKGWHELDGRSPEHNARKHFTEGVVFFAQTAKEPKEAAKSLVVRMAAVAPRFPVNAEATAKAIEAYRSRKRFNWKAMEKAWGRAVNIETWRADCKRWRFGRGDLSTS